MLTIAIGLSASKVAIIESSQNTLSILIVNKPISIDDLKPIHVLVGLPSNLLPELEIQMYNKKNLDDSLSDLNDTSVEWLQIQQLRGLWVGTLKISPGLVKSQYFQNISISMNLDKNSMSNKIGINDGVLSSSVINWKDAKYWVQSKTKSLSKPADLPNGQWLKVSIPKDGMYKIEGSTLLDLVSNIENYDTRSFIMYTGSNLGRSQSQIPGRPTPVDNLTEIAFQYNGSNDGTFTANDKILFYGRGASGFDNNGMSVIYNQNLYFTENIYWLLIPDDGDLKGSRVSEYQNNESPVVTIDYGIRYTHLENDLINPFESGLGWAEQSISNNNYFLKTITINNPIEDISTKLIAGFLGGTTDNNLRPSPLNTLSLSVNTQQSDNLGSISWTGLGQRKTTVTIADDLITSGENSFYFFNSSNDSYSQPYFDYLTLSYGQQLIYNGEQYEFYTPIHSNPVSYNINSNETLSMWNVTDPINPNVLVVSQSGTNYHVTVSSPINTYDRIVVFDDSNISSVSNVEHLGQSSFNNLRNTNSQANHVVIAPMEYSDVVQKILVHRSNSIFTHIETIYNEFSGGNPDPMAIRNFIEWTQINWQSPAPTEIFMIGDADYDYRNITRNSNNIIPTVEVGITNSYATDDRLATINGYIPEVALGRFPAQSIEEAEDYIDKIIEFETNPEYGLWRQRVTLIADDGARPEDSPSELNIGKSHTINSEILANIIPKAIEKYKLYMMEFPEESDATSFGVAKPEATSALFDILEKGTALVNYIGHGSAHQWAQERLLYQDRGDLQLIDTEMRLPIWIAGTCSWGHFDDIGRESFSEELIRQPMNGASAIITTSRPITVTSNQYYEEQLFNQIFPDGGVSNKSIGIILQSIKTGNQEGEYFHLFGDPAMKLPLPSGKIEITSITPDTLVTLGESTYTAEQNLSTSGGEGFAILNEEEREVTREYNFLSNTESLSYKLPGANLFRGKFSFTDKSIEGQFRIPKDISSSSKSTSLKLYTFSNDNNPFESIGIIDSLNIKSGGESNDKFGPIITFETETGRILRSGDHIIENENVLIRLTDPLGINLTGEMGHDIVLTNLSQDEEIIITDDFIYDNNSITTGTIPLNFDQMESDIYISLKAWDSANNPAEAGVKLHRIAEAKLKLFNVLNFPNPFSKSTQFTFEISQSAEVSITIFTLGGKKIMEIEAIDYSIGFHAIDWNGNDAYGAKLANGVYLYKLKAKGDDESASFIGRLAKYE